MKILIVISNPSIGGTETFITSLFPHLRKYGIEADIINTWKDSEVKILANKVNLNYIELGGRSRHITMRNIKEIAHHIKTNEYSVIMGFGIRVSMLLRPLKYFINKTPVIIGLRGLDKWRKWYHIWPDRLTDFACDMFVPNSQAVAKLRMEREKTAADKIVVIKNGIDVSYFDRSRCSNADKVDYGFPNNKLLITMVGNFRVQKGHDFLLDVIEDFYSVLQNVHFAWAGEGPLKETFQKRIKQIHAEENISILGRVDDVRRLLTCSDIAVIPSCEEGMPRCLMEAMAMSLPCVATTVGGTPEVVENEISGLLADYGDVLGFGNNLMKLIGSPELRAKIGTAARRRIVDYFGIETIAAQYAKLFGLFCSGERNGCKIQGILNSCK